MFPPKKSLACNIYSPGLPVQDEVTALEGGEDSWTCWAELPDLAIFISLSKIDLFVSKSERENK